MSETLTNGVIVPDKGSRDWYADLRSNWLKLDSLMAGGNITINPAQTDGILVATITVGGKKYELYQQDGDVSVKIDPSTENAEYPLVASTSAEANTGSVVMAPAVTVNPSTGAVTATSFKGKLEGNASTATNATKAVQDGAGAVIADTYATKTELNTKANDAGVVHKSGNETINGVKTFTSETVNTSLHALRHIYGDYGTFWRQDGINLFLMLTNRGDQYGQWNDFRPLTVNLATGTCGISGNAATATKATQDAAGNIITTTYAKDANVVHKSGNETIAGLKTFSAWQIIDSGLNVRWITGNKEQKSLHLYGSMNDKYEGFGSTLELHGDDANYGMFSLIAKDKTNTNVKRFDGFFDGTLTWDGKKVLTDANQIMLAKNLSGTNVAPGGIIDCGNGNGKLKQWYLNADGTFALANTLPTGIWKSTSFVSLAPNEGGMFIKIG